MTQYNTLNVKLSNSQLNKIKSGIKNGTEVTLKLSSKIVGGSNNENNFSHKLLLTNTPQGLKLRKAFANNSSTNIKLSKNEFLKVDLKIILIVSFYIGLSGGFLGRLLRPLLKAGMPLMKNVLKPLANVLISLGLTAAASAADAAIHKKIFGSGVTKLIISNIDMNDIMKIVKSLEEFGLLVKDVSETVKNGAKEQKGGLLGMLLGTVCASLSGNLLTGRGTIITVEDTVRAGEGTVRAGQDF